MHGLYHDLNKTTDSPVEGMVAAPPVCRATHEDWPRPGLTSTDGLRGLLDQPDIGPEDTPDALEGEATVRYDVSRARFCADFVHEDLMYRTERVKKVPNQPAERMPGGNVQGESGRHCARHRSPLSSGQ